MIKRIVLITCALVSGLYCSVCHSKDGNLPSSPPPFSIVVEVLKDGKLVGVGKCDVRINLGNWRDRIEIIEFVESESYLDEKPATYVNPEYCI